MLVQNSVSVRRFKPRSGRNFATSSVVQAKGLARRRVSHARQVMNGFTRRKPRKVRQTRSFSLAVAAFGMLILSHSTGAQPLGIDPSAAPPHGLGAQTTDGVT